MPVPNLHHTCVVQSCVVAYVVPCLYTYMHACMHTYIITYMHMQDMIFSFELRAKLLYGSTSYQSETSRTLRGWL